MTHWRKLRGGGAAGRVDYLVGQGFFTAGEVDATIAATKKAGMNALFIEVRKFADAYYDSKIEPHGSNIAADFDPLAYTIKKAHAEGIQVHAWVVVYRAWCGAKSGPERSQPYRQQASRLGCAQQGRQELGGRGDVPRPRRARGARVYRVGASRISPSATTWTAFNTTTFATPAATGATPRRRSSATTPTPARTPNPRPRTRNGCSGSAIR